MKTSRIISLFTVLIIVMVALTFNSCKEKDSSQINIGGDSPGEPCPGIPTITDPRDGQVYPTVLIRSLCWLQKNMNYETGNSWCYDNDTANCTTYGRLYDWDTFMNGASSSNSVPSGVQGVCPPGWHVPSDAEWCTLTQYIDSGVNCNSEGWSGTDIGVMMKSTSGWNNNGNGDNRSGFTALPGGYRSTNGSFDALTNYANFWSSTEYSSTDAWLRNLTYYYDAIDRGNANKKKRIFGPLRTGLII